jgi:signal peptidase II
VKRWIAFFLLFVATLVADQTSKSWARGALGAVRQRTVVPQYFDLRYAENQGIAFSLLQRLPGGRWLLVGLGVLAVVLILLYLVRSGAQRLRTLLPLALIAGGALGNLADRALHGKVVDFLFLHSGRHAWPIFNVADVAVVAGAIALVIFSPRAGREPPSAPGRAA